MQEKQKVYDSCEFEKYSELFSTSDDILISKLRKGNPKLLKNMSCSFHKLEKMCIQNNGEKREKS